MRLKRLRRSGALALAAMLLVAACLFIASGRLDWLMGWLYVGVVTAMTAISRILLVKRRPDLAAETGAPDACTTCHADRDPAWAAAEIAARAIHGIAEAEHHAALIDGAGNIVAGPADKGAVAEARGGQLLGRGRRSQGDEGQAKQDEGGEPLVKLSDHWSTPYDDATCAGLTVEL